LRDLGSSNAERLWNTGGKLVMGRMVRRRLGIIAVSVFTLLIIVLAVWRLIPIRGYVSESLSTNPRLIIISQVYIGEKPGIQSRILDIHQAIKVKRLLYFLNSRYLVLPKDTIVTGLIVSPYDYYITLRYQDPSEDQSVIVDLPYHYIENIKTSTIYDIAYSPDYGNYIKFVNFLRTII
jgi:hypothetical protein